MTQKNNAILYITIFAWVTLAVLIILSPDRFINDESIYYENLSSIHPPFSVEFIKHYKGTAGIITTWFHLLILDFTNGDIVRMRITNLFWLFLTAVCFNKSLKDEEHSPGKYFGFTIVFAPYVFPMTARVMGDYPSFFFGFLFYFLFSHLEKLNHKWYWYLITGFVGSVAIAGKQTFIFLLCFPLLSFISDKNNFWKKILLLISACALPGYFYWIWGGLLPKSSGFKYNYETIGYIACAYAFITFSIIAIIFCSASLKSYFLSHLKKILLAVIFVHLLFGVIMPLPFLKSYVSQPNLHSAFIILNYFWSGAIILLFLTGLGFFYSMSKNTGIRHAPLIVFISLWFLVFLKVPVFQGRYIALIIPFILLGFIKEKRINVTLYSAGLGYFFNLITTLILYYPILIRNFVQLIMKSFGIEKA